jgi:hypothetical protein
VVKFAILRTKIFKPFQNPLVEEEGSCGGRSRFPKAIQGYSSLPKPIQGFFEKIFFICPESFRGSRFNASTILFPPLKPENSFARRPQPQYRSSQPIPATPPPCFLLALACLAEALAKADPRLRILRPLANLPGQMQTGWAGKLNKKMMQTSFTLNLPTTPLQHLALAFAAKFWCLFCLMEVIVKPAWQKF